MAQLPPTGFDFLDLDDIGIRWQGEIILDTHGRQDEAHFLRDGAAQPLDLIRQPRRIAGSERKQPIAQFQPQQIHLERFANRQISLWRRQRRCTRGNVALLFLLHQAPRGKARRTCKRSKGQEGHARHQRHDSRSAGSDGQRLGA